MKLGLLPNYIGGVPLKVGNPELDGPPAWVHCHKCKRIHRYSYEDRCAQCALEFGVSKWAQKWAARQRERGLL